MRFFGRRQNSAHEVGGSRAGDPVGEGEYERLIKLLEEERKAWR